jgi:hypothetical protein
MPVTIYGHGSLGATIYGQGAVATSKDGYSAGGPPGLAGFAGHRVTVETIPSHRHRRRFLAPPFDPSWQLASRELGDLELADLYELLLNSCPFLPDQGGKTPSVPIWSGAGIGIPAASMARPAVLMSRPCGYCDGAAAGGGGRAGAGGMRRRLVDRLCD